MRLKDPRYRQKKVLQQFLHLIMIWLAVRHNFDFRIRISNYLDNIVLNLEQAVQCHIVGLKVILIFIHLQFQGYFRMAFAIS